MSAALKDLTDNCYGKLSRDPTAHMLLETLQSAWNVL